MRSAFIVSAVRVPTGKFLGTLKDFAAPDGELGYFSKQFDVYDREGEPCRGCAGKVKRIVQGGRSTFFCPSCQR